jgi:hypothetical protein
MVKNSNMQENNKSTEEKFIYVIGLINRLVQYFDLSLDDFERAANKAKKTFDNKLINEQNINPENIHELLSKLAFELKKRRGVFDAAIESNIGTIINCRKILNEISTILEEDKTLHTKMIVLATSLPVVIEKTSDLLSSCIRYSDSEGDSKISEAMNIQSYFLEIFLSVKDWQSFYYTKSKNSKSVFINETRIEELRSIKSDKFDLSRLIKLCIELNISYRENCYLSVSMLTRAILDHIPPIFGYKTFNEVINNYKGTSAFKKQVEHLNNTSRNIADTYLHTTIREKESLPNETQINFTNDVDILLSEIIRILK